MQTKFRVIVQVAMMIALSVVLARFVSINTLYLRVSFGFVPVVICAILYGPMWAAATAGIADIIGTILFPVGPYFPGFTVTAMLTGIIFGLFLYKREEKSILCLTGAVLTNAVVVSLLANTVNLTILTGTPFLTLLPTRLFQNALMIPIMLVSCGVCLAIVKSIKRRYA